MYCNWPGTQSHGPQGVLRACTLPFCSSSTLRALQTPPANPLPIVGNWPRCSAAPEESLGRWLPSLFDKPRFGDRCPFPRTRGSAGSGSANNNPFADQLSHSMTDLRTDSGQEGWWEKYESESGGKTAKQWDPWGNPQPSKRGTGKPQGNNWAETVDSRWQSSKEISMAHSSGKCWESAYGRNQDGKASEGVVLGGPCGGCDSGSDATTVQLDDGSDSDDFEESMDDVLSDDYDSDVSPKSHEMRKKNKWFRMFFETFDSLSVDQINGSTRRWHCPACQHGPGSIAWYKGLQPLISHAKTKGAGRTRLHREFAELLEVELSIRGISVILAGETFRQWKSLPETRADHDIVWPPLVVVMNTMLEQDENDKWVGMGSQELLDYFPSYAAVKARHSYGPRGHRGISVLIFEASPIGYMEAQCLHKHFADEGKGREAWEHHGVIFCPGGKRQLYGFLAHKEDVDEFNKHSRGRFQLKFEMRSYQEMVVDPMGQMNDDNRQLVWLKNNVAKLQQHSETLEDTLQVLRQKLHETMKENMILRHKTKMLHDENKEEMDQQEQISKEQMDKVLMATEEQEMMFEKLLQEEKHVKAPQCNVEEETLGEKEKAKVVDDLVKGVERLLAEHGRLEHAHEECKSELRRMKISRD
ncbi:hypothetical protein Taro_015903 [Colocasia esculenta]|uniref:Uncharacterized protein n=1 Tax=Colocasia esculenta TaxID=4460 RepID=A0A843UNK7_COLES|nr:hypothetical protein [Colocasia esculenta]